MENMLTIAYLSIALASFFLSLKSTSRFLSLLTYLFSTTTLLLFSKSSEGSSEVKLLIGTLMVILSLGFILSQVNKVKTSRFAFLIPLLPCFGLLMFGQMSFEISGFEFSFLGPVFVLPILGALYYPLINLKSDFLHKQIQFSSDSKVVEGTSIIFLGLVVLIAFFLASFFGIFLLGFALALSTFFNKRKSNHEAEALILISLTPIFLEQGSIDMVDLTIGKTLTGLFVGFGILLLISEIASAQSRKILISIIGVFLSCLLTIALILLGTVKSDFGGLESFIGLIAGLSLGMMMSKRSELIIALASLVLVAGFTFIPLTVNTEEQEFSINDLEVKEEKNEKKSDPFDVVGKDLDNLQGDFILDENSAQLNFQLGPKGGITKGAIKSFTGKVFLAEDITKSTFEISLPVIQLTTFNKFRDEAIYEESYFNLPKYPDMKYVSKSLIKESDTYILNGNFTMLGITQPLEVKLKYLGETKNASGKTVPVLIGKSSIDRTKHGMKADSKEGNIVDFEFKVELTEK